MKPKKVSVIGCGYVGLVTGACLAEIGHQVVCIDNDRSKYEALMQGRVPIFEAGLERLIKKNVAAKRLSFKQWVKEGPQDAEVIFIAVGTPPNPDGSANLTYIQSVAQGIAESMSRYTVVVEKSTVPVQTGEDVERTINRFKPQGVSFDMVSNPEFLQEGTAVEDFLKPDRIVLGVKSKRAEKIMRDLYAPLKCKNILVTDLKSAELIKHASNSFLATKISFINAVSRVCEQVGADATEVARGMGLDPRIGGSFLKAGIGFGGFCLPKDLEAFYYISKKVGYDFELLRTVKDINEAQRIHFVNKLKNALGGLAGKTVAVWGVAFKPKTDDIRFAPSLDIIANLQSQGAKVKAFDPIAQEKAKAAVADVEFCPNAYLAAREADAVALVTEWPEFQRLDFKRLKKEMAGTVVVDGRNCLDAVKLRRLGFNYQGMGKP